MKKILLSLLILCLMCLPAFAGGFDISNRTSLLGLNSVGIGTTLPLAKLHIRDSASGATPYWTDSGLIIEKADFPVLQFLSSASGNAYINFGDPAGSAVGHIVYKHTKNEGGIDYFDYLEAVVGGQGVFAFASNKVWLTGPIGVNPGVSVYANTPDAMLSVRGAGDTAATYTLHIKNSSNVSSLLVRDDGRVGVGVVAPTATLHLKAGSATAGTAPLKFSSGTLLAAPAAGAVEFLADAFYGTITTGAARKQFAFTDSSITGNAATATALATTPAGAEGKATCWKAAGVLGYCSSVVAADGSCTCN